MATLIVYGTKYGSTEKFASLIKDSLSDEAVTVINLKQNKNIDLSGYDTVIVGGSVYAGQLRKEVVKFCEKHEQALLTKKLGLFISCGFTPPKSDEQLQVVYSETLINHATAIGALGGEIIIDTLKPMDKFLITKMMKMTEDVVNSFDEVIKEFVTTLNA